MIRRIYKFIFITLNEMQKITFPVKEEFIYIHLATGFKQAPTSVIMFLTLCVIRTQIKRRSKWSRKGKFGSESLKVEKKLFPA